jgi:terminase small subunit / prophage DNA-packing protein
MSTKPKAKPPPGQKTPAPKPVSAAHVGVILGLSEGQVRELGRRGTLPRLGNGRYPLRPTILAYCENLRAAAARHGQTPDPGAPALTAERRRLVGGQADKVALQNAVTRGELVATADVRAEWTAICAALRARVLAVSSRVQQRLVHLTAAEVATIDRELRDALTELGTDHERDQPNTSRSAAASDPAATASSEPVDRIAHAASV